MLDDILKDIRRAFGMPEGHYEPEYDTQQAEDSYYETAYATPTEFTISTQPAPPPPMTTTRSANAPVSTSFSQASHGITPSTADMAPHMKRKHDDDSDQVLSRSVRPRTDNFTFGASDARRASHSMTIMPPARSSQPSGNMMRRSSVQSENSEIADPPYELSLGARELSSQHFDYSAPLAALQAQLANSLAPPPGPPPQPVQLALTPPTSPPATSPVDTIPTTAASDMAVYVPHPSTPQVRRKHARQQSALLPSPDSIIGASDPREKVPSTYDGGSDPVDRQVAVVLASTPRVLASTPRNIAGLPTRSQSSTPSHGAVLSTSDKGPPTNAVKINRSQRPPRPFEQNPTNEKDWNEVIHSHVKGLWEQGDRYDREALHNYPEPGLSTYGPLEWDKALGRPTFKISLARLIQNVIMSKPTQRALKSEITAAFMDKWPELKPYSRANNKDTPWSWEAHVREKLARPATGFYRVQPEGPQKALRGGALPYAFSLRLCLKEREKEKTNKGKKRMTREEEGELDSESLPESPSKRSRKGKEPQRKTPPPQHMRKTPPPLQRALPIRVQRASPGPSNLTGVSIGPRAVDFHHNFGASLAGMILPNAAMLPSFNTMASQPSPGASAIFDEYINHSPQAAEPVQPTSLPDVLNYNLSMTTLPSSLSASTIATAAPAGVPSILPPLPFFTPYNAPTSASFGGVIQLDPDDEPIDYSSGQLEPEFFTENTLVQNVADFDPDGAPEIGPPALDQRGNATVQPYTDFELPEAPEIPYPLLEIESPAPQIEYYAPLELNPYLRPPRRLSLQPMWLFNRLEQQPDAVSRYPPPPSPSSSRRESCSSTSSVGNGYDFTDSYNSVMSLRR